MNHLQKTRNFKQIIHERFTNLDETFTNNMPARVNHSKKNSQAEPFTTNNSRAQTNHSWTNVQPRSVKINLPTQTNNSWMTRSLNRIIQKWLISLNKSFRNDSPVRMNTSQMAGKIEQIVENQLTSQKLWFYESLNQTNRSKTTRKSEKIVHKQLTSSIESFTNDSRV